MRRVRRPARPRGDLRLHHRFGGRAVRTSSLAHEISELLRLEREARENGYNPVQRQRVRIWERRRDLYFRVAQECRAEGDIAGFTEAKRATGHAVTMVHRCTEIGSCSVCGALELVDWQGVENDRDLWNCHNRGRRWTTPHGIKPTEI